MSLAIQIDKVMEILLSDGWHRVEPGSFTVDSYEFLQGDELLVSGGQVAGVPSTGAGWKELNASPMACPLTSILALRLSTSLPKGSRITR